MKGLYLKTRFFLGRFYVFQKGLPDAAVQDILSWKVDATRPSFKVLETDKKKKKNKVRFQRIVNTH
jgi:hypothetical protein